MFTFAMATLETFGPVTELTEVRDRIVGIILGIIVAGLIHTLIRPEREGGIILQKISILFGRDADLVVMVDCQIPSDDLIVHFF
jgi:multidrug resistance protein MdtO